LASDVQQAGFVADLGVAFMDDLVFLAYRVVGNEKD